MGPGPKERVKFCLGISQIGPFGDSQVLSQNLKNSALSLPLSEMPWLELQSDVMKAEGTRIAQGSGTFPGVPEILRKWLPYMWGRRRPPAVAE